MAGLADELARHLVQPKQSTSLADQLSQHLNQKPEPASPVEDAPHPASLLQKIADYAEVPFDLGNAAQRSRLAGHGEFGPEFHQALDVIKRDPVAAAEEYGVNSPGELEYGSTHHDPLEPFGEDWARFNKKHPKETGVETFAAELGNPSNAVLGGVVGGAFKGAGMGVRALAQRPDIAGKLAQSLVRSGDRFADLRRVAGDKGVHAIRSLLGHWSGADTSSMDDTMKIFGGLSPEEKREVIHLSQGREPSVDVRGRAAREMTNAQAQAATIRKTAPAAAGRPIVGARGQELAKRAQLLRNTLKNLDVEQKKYPALLEDVRTSDTDRFFPMKGAYTDPILNELAEHNSPDVMRDLEAQLEDIRSKQGAGGQLNVRKGTAGKQGGHKVFATLREAEESGKLREDWDPAQNLYSHLSRRRKNMAFEQAMQHLPDSLRRDISYVDAAGNVVRDETGKPVTGARFQEWLKKNPLTDAGAFKAAPPPPGMVPSKDVLWRLGSPTMLESYVHPDLANFLAETAGKPDSARRGFWKGLDTFNRVSRAAIITNPLVHGLWNLGTNSMARGVMLSDLVKPVPKAIQDEAEAAGAYHGLGSTSSFFGGDAAHLATTPLKNLGPKEWLDKVAMHAWDANQKITFDKMEKFWADRLFYRLRRSGLNPGEAAEQVRKALGDYANTSPTDKLQRAFFFYPWLRSNLDFWVGRAAHAPQYVNAPVQAIHRNNEVAGDPNLDSKYPTADFTMYEGNGRYYSVPHPARILADLSMGLPGIEKIILSHMTPPMSMAADALKSMNVDKDPSTDPHIIFQRSAPPLEQAKQTADYLIGKSPIPMAQQLKGLPQWIQSLRQYGLTPSDILGMTGGFTYNRSDDASERAIRYAFRSYQMNASAAQTPADKQRAWDDYQAQVRDILQSAAH
jgi:hypothetical protein